MTVLTIPTTESDDSSASVSLRPLAIVVLGAFVITRLYSLGEVVVRGSQDDGSALTYALVGAAKLLPAWYFAQRRWYVPSLVAFVGPSIFMLTTLSAVEFSIATVVVDVLLTSVAAAHVFYGGAAHRVLPVSIGAAWLLLRAALTAAMWAGLTAKESFNEAAPLRLHALISVATWAVVLLYALRLATLTRGTNLRQASTSLHRFWKPTALVAAAFVAIGSASAWHRTATRWTRWEDVEMSGLEMNGRYTLPLAGLLVAAVVAAHVWHNAQRVLAAVGAVIGMTITLATLTGSDVFAFTPARFMTLLAGLVALTSGLVGIADGLNGSAHYLRKALAGTLSLWGVGIAVAAHHAWGRPPGVFRVTKLTDLDEVTRLAEPGFGRFGVVLGIAIAVAGVAALSGRGWNRCCFVILIASIAALTLAMNDYPYRGPFEGVTHRGQVMTIIFAIAAAATAAVGFRLTPAGES